MILLASFALLNKKIVKNVSLFPKVIISLLLTNDSGVIGVSFALNESLPGPI